MQIGTLGESRQACEMYTGSAAHYDRIYSSFKDYAAEADALAAVIREVHPRARTVLDVACGTGAHAAALAAVHGFEVDGIDLDPALLAIARAKCPRGRFVDADMADFDLGRTYDAVLCLFGSIGYLVTRPRLWAALARLRAHLAPGGVAVVEPFLTPDAFGAGRTGSVTAESDGVRVTRRNRSERDGGVCRLSFDYEIAGPAGVEHSSEVHTLGLFSVEETLAGFAAADLTARHEPGGPMGRDRYIATPVPRVRSERA
jgi:ubiquinone/menaquinone biosynthesis C-methylase UbiE